MTSHQLEPAACPVRCCTWATGTPRRAAALALASTCVDMRITQVANQTWGVHAVLPTGLLGRDETGLPAR